MRRVARFLAVGLVLALALAGYSLQQAFGQSRPVYTLPDGTKVRGEAAEWLYSIIGNGEALASTDEGPRLLFGDRFVLPDMPDRFHVVGYWAVKRVRSSPGRPGVRQTIKAAGVAWAAPETKEWVTVSFAADPDPPSPTPYVESPYCSDRNDANEKISKARPWASHECRATIILPNLWVNFWMVNVPEGDAKSVVESGARKLMAAMEG